MWRSSRSAAGFDEIGSSHTCLNRLICPRIQFISSIEIARAGGLASKVCMTCRNDPAGGSSLALAAASRSSSLGRMSFMSYHCFPSTDKPCRLLITKYRLGKILVSDRIDSTIAEADSSFHGRFSVWFCVLMLCIITYLHHASCSDRKLPIARSLNAIRAPCHESYLFDRGGCSPRDYFCSL